ncbi:MAG: DUF697 domain-containing protein [Burkholderiaceae bacterium]|nr:DUF697 domain-containing protein [Burkholderiaceae bacterium]
MANPLDEITSLSAPRKSVVTNRVATTTAQKKALTKTVKKTVAKKVIAKKTSDVKKPVSQVIPPEKRPAQKRVTKKATAKQVNQVIASDTASFDALAQVVVDNASKDAEMKRTSQETSQASEHTAPKRRADEVFEAELCNEPQKELVRMRVTSDREMRGMKVVKSWSQWSVAAGFVPVPFVDIALVSGIQVKMIYDLCQIYNVPFKKEAALAYASGLVGGSLTAGAAQIVGAMALKAVPYVDQLVQPTFAFATTYAMGYVFVKHFENSGTMASFDSSKMNLYFQEQFEKSKKIFSKKQAAPA